MNENRLRMSLSLLAMVVGAGCAASSQPDDATFTEGAMTSAEPLPTRGGCPGTWEHVHQYGGLEGGKYTGIGDNPLITSATFSDITSDGGYKFHGHIEKTVPDRASAYGEEYTWTGEFLALAENSRVLPGFDFYSKVDAEGRPYFFGGPIVYGVREGENNTIRELCLVAGAPFGGFILKRDE